MRPLIISDLDGTLVNIYDDLLEMLWHNLGVALRPQDVTQYDVAAALYPHLKKQKAPIASQDDFAAWLTRQCWDNPALYEVAKPYWDLHVAYQHAMSAQSADIVFCTSRPESEEVEDATLKWLHAWGYDGHDCYFAQSFSNGKASVIDEILDGDKRPLWIVEDDVEAAKEMEEVVLEAGWECHVFYPERPWTKNQVNYQIIPAIENLVRVASGVAQ